MQTCIPDPTMLPDSAGQYKFLFEEAQYDTSRKPYVGKVFRIKSERDKHLIPAFCTAVLRLQDCNLFRPQVSYFIHWSTGL